MDLLESISVPRYKIASGEVTNIPLLERIAATGKPVLLSSGMSDWKELDRAVVTLKQGTKDIVVLQCTSAYPCPYKRVGLNVLAEMRERYRLPVGLSDHTLTNYASFAAVTLGAAVIEKHLTFSRQGYGSDAPHSLEPNELADLVQGIRAIETMLKTKVDKSDAKLFAEMKVVFEKSVVSVTDIAKGTVITADMVAVKKPGTGIPAAQLAAVIGAMAVRDIKADSVLQKKDFHSAS